MTVQELIDRLAQLDPDHEVYLSYDYGDHRHTPAAVPIRGVNHNVVLESTGYSPSGLRVSDGNEATETECGNSVVVLS